ncbi:MAG: AI-2E family transporter [Candidatus Levyibacteriota bacterium]
MLDEVKKELTSLKLLSILLTIAVAVYLLQFAWQFLGNFSDVFAIIILSWLLSFILEPVVDLFSNFFKTSKTISAILAYILLAIILLAIVLLFIPVVIYQLDILSKVLPNYLKTAPIFVQKWSENLVSSLGNYTSFIPSVANFLFSSLIIFIISFYLIVDKKRIDAEGYEFMPKKWHKNFRMIQNIINTTFASFIRVQLTFALINGVATWAVLRLLGIDFAASTGVISGILTIIPLIGPILAIIPPVFLAFILDPAMALIVFIILLIFQQFVFNIWGPKFIGKAFKIHPIIVLLSFFVGVKIAGTMGAIFAIPFISIIILVIRNLGRYFISPKDA